MTTSTTGPRNAQTDAQSGLRYYTWKGQQLISVTSMRKLLGMPFPLAQWQMNQAIKAAIDNADNLGNMVYDDRQMGTDATSTFLRQQALLVRDKAASRGTAIHEAAALGVDPATADEEIALPLAQYYDFLDRSKARVLLTERQVFNLKMGYAGSLDLMAAFRPPFVSSPRKLVIDIKTGKGLYIDHAIQLMAYAGAEFIGADNVIDMAATKHLGEANGFAILKLTDTDWELVEIRPTPELFKAFEAMVTFAKWQEATPTIDSLVAGRIRSQ